MFSVPAPGTVHGFCVSSRSDTAVLRIAGAAGTTWRPGLAGRLDEVGMPDPHALGSDLPEGGLLECRVQMATEKALVTLARGRRERPSPRESKSIQVVA